MAQFRLPGPLDGHQQQLIVADGTLARQPMGRPGSLAGPTPTAPAGGSSWALLQRAQCVLEACQRARQRVIAAVLRRTGEALEALLDALIPALLGMMAVVVITSVIGGAAGALIGFVFGGAGAAPGAVLGAQAGMNLGVWLLTWLGLGFLVVEIGRGLGEMAAKAQAGVLMAWEAQGHSDENTRVDRAADELADAVALLIQLILMAIVARLTYGQARAGNASAAASLDDLVASLRQSKLGAGFADWVALNAQRLVRNPKLQRQRELGGPQAVSEAQTPSQMRRAREAEAAPAAPAGMKRKDICFNNRSKLPTGEYDRQLAGQQRGLNDMTVQEYLDGRARYQEVGRQGTGRAQAEMRAQYATELADKFETQLSKQGIVGIEAQQKAAAMTAERMKALAALHNPDMIAGGKDVVLEMGDKRVNSSIGAQWKDRVEALDDEARKIPESARGSTKMNTQLRRC